MWMGIDGGGSNLRVVIVDDDLRVLAESRESGVNPNAVGHEVAAGRIQTAMRSALSTAGLSTVAGVGIGIAGAAARHSAEWLVDVVRPVLPDAHIAPGSDEEIALVGARGRRDGVILLAGTGSAAYGVALDGRTYRAGGWGYLLGDEGSGYWIGLEALKLVSLRGDGRLMGQTRLPEVIMAQIGLESPDALIGWTYRNATPAMIAALAPEVIALAAEDDGAKHIVNRAAAHLADLVNFVASQLHMTPDDIVFTGSIITTENALSALVCDLLGLVRLPPTRYPPVVGAALLAKITAG